ncbi:MAG: DUF507 family protein [Myxococcota bacterium]|nr:DUF507 family protein [Myxococcota bacterium]
MRIYRERIPSVSTQIVKALLAADLIEVEAEQVPEVELDIASVLTEYRRTDWELGEQAKDIVANRGLDYSHTRKIKSKLAAEKRFGIGDDAMDWLVDQMLEMMLQSRNVEEVFGEDRELRKVISPVLRSELGVESDLDREVKKHIRNFEEGTSDYEIEYQKTMDRIRRTRGME